MSEQLRAAALASLIVAGTVGGAFAQADAPATDAPVVAQTEVADDDGFDLGWLGLLGLLGLAGLARRKEPVHRHTTTTGTTGTTGTTRI